MYHFELKYTPRLISLLREIDCSAGVISERKVEESWEKSARFSARCHNIADALRLEGISAPYLTVKRILEGDYALQDTANMQEILNYNQALGYIDILAGSEEAISESAFKELSRMCLQGIAKAVKLQGSYRAIQNWVINSDADQIIYTPPSPESVPPLMQELYYWINGESFLNLHPVAAAGALHHRFLVINPFVFANVRIACLLSRLILLKYGYGLNRLIWFEGLFARDIEYYYDNLYRNYKFSSGASDKTVTWLEYYAEAIKTSYDYILQASSENLLRTQVKIPVSEVAPQKPPTISTPQETPVSAAVQLNERQRRILETAKKYRTFHRRDINAELAITARYNPKTVSRDLRALVDTGYLIQGGERKGIYYSLNPSFELPPEEIRP